MAASQSLDTLYLMPCNKADMARLLQRPSWANTQGGVPISAQQLPQWHAAAVPLQQAPPSQQAAQSGGQAGAQAAVAVTVAANTTTPQVQTPYQPQELENMENATAGKHRHLNKQLWPIAKTWASTCRKSMPYFAAGKAVQLSS